MTALLLACTCRLSLAAVALQPPSQQQQVSLNFSLPASEAGSNDLSLSEPPVSSPG